MKSLGFTVFETAPIPFVLVQCTAKQSKARDCCHYRNCIVITISNQHVLLEHNCEIVSHCAISDVVG